MMSCTQKSPWNSQRVINRYTSMQEKIGHKRTKMHSWQRPFEHVETRPCVDCAPLQRHLSTPCPSWLSPGASLQTCSSAIHNVRTCRAAQTQHRLTCSYSERKVSTAGIPPEMSVVLPAPDVWVPRRTCNVSEPEHAPGTARVCRRPVSLHQTELDICHATHTHIHL